MESSTTVGCDDEGSAPRCRPSPAEFKGMTAQQLRGIQAAQLEAAEEHRRSLAAQAATAREAALVQQAAAARVLAQQARQVWSLCVGAFPAGA